MSKIKWPAGLLLLALIAGVFFSPHWVVRRMAEAAREHDAAKFSSHVDYPALQAHVRAQVRGRLIGQPDSPWAALRGVVAAVVTDPMVDALITPEALSAWMTQGRSHGTPRQERRRRGPQGDGEGGGPDRRPPEASMSMGYASWDQFEVQVQRQPAHQGDQAGEPPEPVVFILSREGLLSWRLSGIEFPQ
jgi:Protein of unknown function (DUF2939)